jgi:hypothetical protein
MNFRRNQGAKSICTLTFSDLLHPIRVRKTNRRLFMAISTQRLDLNDPLPNIGPDSTAVFDESPSNPTVHASSENLSAASKQEDDEDEDEDEELDDEEEDEDEDEDEEDDDGDEDEEEDDDELKVAPARWRGSSGGLTSESETWFSRLSASGSVAGV